MMDDGHENSLGGFVKASDVLSLAWPGWTADRGAYLEIAVYDGRVTRVEVQHALRHVDGHREAKLEAHRPCFVVQHLPKEFFEIYNVKINKLKTIYTFLSFYEFTNIVLGL